ncbi:MAG TPA: glycerophosphodiester phosphodiesterase [Pirellulales bacterium]|jgi:glycerophosphoryl diester phosphodiesterase|nr:glycerophosphodiester phosphodiesterase [Pirellulales bacterium]
MSAVWGHRGCRGLQNPPENSLAAFEAAIVQEADGIELDVFLTTDRVLVVFHADKLDRLTNGSGKIVTKSFADLQVLKLKENCSPNLSDQRIPTLDQVLDLVDQSRQRYRNSHSEEEFVVNIEMKAGDLAEPLGAALRQRLQQGWKAKNFLVSSFEVSNLVKMQSPSLEVPLGVLLSSNEAPWDLTLAEIDKRLASLPIQPQTVNLTLPSLTGEAISRIVAIGARPVAWTYNEINPELLPTQKQQAMAELLLQNNIPLITDYPRQMRQLLENYSTHEH